MRRLVARLRAAGAIVLGKANLSEWANFRSTHSNSGWSALGGQTRNACARAQPFGLQGRLWGGSGVETDLQGAGRAPGTRIAPGGNPTLSDRIAAEMLRA